MRGVERTTSPLRNVLNRWTREGVTISVRQSILQKAINESGSSWTPSTTSTSATCTTDWFRSKMSKIPSMRFPANLEASSITLLPEIVVAARSASRAMPTTLTEAREEEREGVAREEEREGVAREEEREGVAKEEETEVAREEVTNEEEVAREEEEREEEEREGVAREEEREGVAREEEREGVAMEEET